MDGPTEGRLEAAPTNQILFVESARFVSQNRPTASGLLTEFPADLRLLANAEPVYETLPGWSSPTKGVTRMSDLPVEAKRYLTRLEEVSGVACGLISTGSDRRETIVKPGSVVEGWMESVPVRT